MNISINYKFSSNDVKSKQSLGWPLLLSLCLIAPCPFFVLCMQGFCMCCVVFCCSVITVEAIEMLFRLNSVVQSSLLLHCSRFIPFDTFIYVYSLRQHEDQQAHDSEYILYLHSNDIICKSSSLSTNRE